MLIRVAQVEAVYVFLPGLWGKESEREGEVSWRNSNLVSIDPPRQSSLWFLMNPRLRVVAHGCSAAISGSLSCCRVREARGRPSVHPSVLTPFCTAVVVHAGKGQWEQGNKRNLHSINIGGALDVAAVYLTTHA